MRIFDCFLFANELDLLEIRLQELAGVVDRFVIAESTTTFSGRTKPLHYWSNRGRFGAFAGQIEHVAVTAAPEADSSAWARRTRQCNALITGLADCAPNDVVILSDVDEIVSAAAIRRVRADPPGWREVLCFELRMYNFFVNLECGVRWLRQGPRGVRRADLRTMERLRKVRGPADKGSQDFVRTISAAWQMGGPVRRRVVPDAGWHFSYTGGAHAVQEKMRSFAGYDRVPDDLKEQSQIAARIKTRRPISFSRRGLTYRALDESFPAHLRENPDRYAALIAAEQIE